MVLVGPRPRGWQLPNYSVLATARAWSCMELDGVECGGRLGHQYYTIPIIKIFNCSQLQTPAHLPEIALFDYKLQGGAEECSRGKTSTPKKKNGWCIHSIEQISHMLPCYRVRFHGIKVAALHHAEVCMCGDYLS